jgi:hypothetical protein
MAVPLHINMIKFSALPESNPPQLQAAIFTGPIPQLNNIEHYNIYHFSRFKVSLQKISIA